jgi:hypothetical protein
MDGNPIKKRKGKEEGDVEKWKKIKPKISVGAAKAIADVKTAPDVGWLERYIEDLCRTNSWPLQLLGSDFIGRLGAMLSPQHSLSTLERLRSDYRTAHPFSQPPTEDYGFLDGISEYKVDE